MTTAAHTGDKVLGTRASKATVRVLAALWICQVARPCAGDKHVSLVAERPTAQYLMKALTGLTAASVLYVLIGGGLAQ